MTRASFSPRPARTRRPTSSSPWALFSELYSVPVAGGEAALVLTQPAIAATVDPAGTKIIYHDQKGYESDWRKHHTSAVTRDIWVYDLKTKKNTQVTTFKGEDRNPVFDGNGDDFYYLSEQSGSFNVRRSSLSKPAVSVPLTDFAKNPVRFLTRAKDGLLCFGYDGEIYTKAGSAAARKVDIRIAQDGRQVLERTLPIGGGITEMRLSPNGKEMAYVFRGEIFTGSVEGGLSKRVTNTAGQERSVSFSPDGRSLVYAAERDNNWNVYKTSIVRQEEPYFFASTVLKEEPVVATAAEEFQPEFSPDGKEVAYLENRVVLKVVNLASKETRLILPADYNYSYADGDQTYKWSPDGKWFLVQFAFVRLFTPQVGLVSSDGKGKVVDLTKNGFGVVAPRWGMDGTMMTYGSPREGAVNTDGSPSREYDVYGMFFTRAAYDRFRLSKDDFALVKEQEDKAKEEKDKADKDKPKAKDAAVKPEEPKKDLVFELDGLDRRKSRLTINFRRYRRHGSDQERREALLPGPLREGLRPVGDRDPDARHQALRQARREPDRDGARRRRQGAVRLRRRADHEDRSRRAASPTPWPSAARWSSTRPPRRPTCTTTCGGR